MKTARNIFLVILFSFCVFAPFAFVSAESKSLSKDVTKQLDAAGTTSGMGTTKSIKDPRQVIADVIQIALSIVGIIFVVLIVMSGYWLITSAGEEDKITEAKSTLKAAIIGIIVVLSAYAITEFVAKRMYNASRIDSQYELNENTYPAF
jgi:CBS domain containing-hemolysin-like protein